MHLNLRFIELKVMIKYFLLNSERKDVEDLKITSKKNHERKMQLLRNIFSRYKNVKLGCVNAVI